MAGISLYDLATKRDNKRRDLLEVGTRMFNHGDMANTEHFGTIAEVIETPDGDHHYRIQVDDDPAREYAIHADFVSKEYLGHGGSRIVTEEAYHEYWEKRGRTRSHCPQS